MTAPANAEDAAVRATARHHARLSNELGTRVERLITAVEVGEGEAIAHARREVVDFCDNQLLPHAGAEETSIYPAAATEGRMRLLVETLLADHRVIASLVDVVRSAYHPVRAAAAAEALRVLFDTHLAKEDTIVLPLVAATPGLSLVSIVAGLHDQLAPG